MREGGGRMREGAWGGGHGGRARASSPKGGCWREICLPRRRAAQSMIATGALEGHGGSGLRLQQQFAVRLPWNGPSTPIRRMLRLHAVVDGVVDGVGLQRDTEHAQAQSDGMAVERMGCGLERRWGWSGHGGLGCPCFRHVPRCWCSLDARCSHYFHSSDASTNDRTTSDPTAAGAKGLQQQKIRDKPLTRTQTRKKKGTGTETNFLHADGVSE